MLAFLKKRPNVTVIDAKTKPEGGVEMIGDDHALSSAMDDLISAIHMKDTQKACEAFQAAFDMCESKPEQEQGEI